ncbi:MAG: hypothetical protein M1484_01080 [Patescibacteria group bacterium]|nr:hypothetical protein [Patescibacteria group bacterium]MCL5431673.1 hypothetical protein [Patescibacteria group bacterium]
MTTGPEYRLNRGVSEFNRMQVWRSFPFFEPASSNYCGLALGNVISAGFEDHRCHPQFEQWLREVYSHKGIFIQAELPANPNGVENQTLVWFNLGGKSFRDALEEINRLRDRVIDERSFPTDKVQILITSTATDLPNARNNRGHPLYNFCKCANLIGWVALPDGEIGMEAKGGLRVEEL